MQYMPTEAPASCPVTGHKDSETFARTLNGVVYTNLVAGENGWFPMDLSRPNGSSPRPAFVSAPLRVALGGALLLLGLLFGAAPFAARAYEDHVVQAGETLAAIAEKYGFPLDTILDVNGLQDPDAIQVGQVIRIPGFANEEAPLTETEPAAAEPPPAAAPPAPAATGSTVHVVRPGEWVSTVAGLYGVSVQSIIDANGLANPDRISIGQFLEILGVPEAPDPEPHMGVHIVELGETLSHVAAQYGLTMLALAELNGIDEPYWVYAGGQLLIPVSASGGAAPSPSGQPSGQPSGIAYTVQAGDSLSAIADRYGVAIQAIVSANGLGDIDAIWVGQVLTIPGASGGRGTAAITHFGQKIHTVKPGESLGTISTQFGVPLSALAAANDITNVNLIEVGQSLVIPGGTRTDLSRDDYARILTNAALEFGIPVALVKAIAWQESGWNMDMVSSASAVGLMQVTPPTADWALEVLIPSATAWEYDAVANARMGAAILHHWLVLSDWNFESAIAAYYQGWHALETVGIFEETKLYLASVYALMARYE